MDDTRNKLAMLAQIWQRDVHLLPRVDADKLFDE